MLVHRFLLTAALVLSAASAHAQTSPGAVKSADQITCELTGDCGDGVAAPMQDRGDTRGFSIARANPAAHTARAGAQIAALPARSAAARSTSYAVPAMPATLPGHRQRLIAPTHKPAAMGRSAIARPALIGSSTPGSSNLEVGFALASSSLDSAGRLQAEALLAALRGPKLTGKHVIIAGHTDSIGGREYNIDLSQRRARALVDYLASNGVSRSLLDPIGYGYDRPLAGLSASEPLNRRVEIVLADATRP